MNMENVTIVAVRVGVVLGCVAFWYAMYAIGGVPLMIGMLASCLLLLTLLVRK